FRDVFCNNFWLTTSGNFSNPALLCCAMEMGIDRILFAIDWPFVQNTQGTNWMENVPLCDEDKAKILSGNAKRILKIGRFHPSPAIGGWIKHLAGAERGGCPNPSVI